MRDINVNLSGVNINYKLASQIAMATAQAINGGKGTYRCRMA